MFFILKWPEEKIKKYTDFYMSIKPNKKNGEATKLREDVIFQKAYDNQLLSRKEIAIIFRCNIEVVSAWVQQGLPVELQGKALKVTRGIKPRFLFYDVLNWLETRSSESVRLSYNSKINSLKQ